MVEMTKLQKPELQKPGPEKNVQQVPIRHQALWLFQTLSEQIENGTLPAGGTLPSQKALMQHYGLSRHIVRKALEMLVERKMISSWQGKGAVVRGREWPYPISMRTRIHESLKDSGADLMIKVIRTLQKKRPDPEIAALLDVSLRERVRFVEFLISTESLPIAIGHHFIAPGVQGDILAQVDNIGEIVASYAALGIDDYVRKRTMVRVRMPTERETGLLHIPRQQPLFVLRGLNIDMDGTILEVTEAIVRGDRIRLEI